MFYLKLSTVQITQQIRPYDPPPAGRPTKYQVPSNAHMRHIRKVVKLRLNELMLHVRDNVKLRTSAVRRKIRDDLKLQAGYATNQNRSTVRDDLKL